ncbi:pentatricopeptide repeat-containing protein, partial [Quercus suber]
NNCFKLKHLPKSNCSKTIPCHTKCFFYQFKCSTPHTNPSVVEKPCWVIHSGPISFCNNVRLGQFVDHLAFGENASLNNCFKLKHLPKSNCSKTIPCHTKCFFYQFKCSTPHTNPCVVEKPCWVIHSGPISFCNNVRLGQKAKDSSGSHLNGQIQALVDMLVAEEATSKLQRISELFAGIFTLSLSSHSSTHRIGNALLSMFVRFGDLGNAWYVFGKMEERDMSLIPPYVKQDIVLPSNTKGNANANYDIHYRRRGRGGAGEEDNAITNYTLYLTRKQSQEATVSLMSFSQMHSKSLFNS